jgi:hypothetical protein
MPITLYKNTLMGKALASLHATAIDNGFYQITEAKAKEINKNKLPKPGYEACVKVLGVWLWLARTRHNNETVWSVRDAKGWHVDTHGTARLSEAGKIAAEKVHLELLPEDADGKQLLKQPDPIFMPPADRPYIVCILDWWDRSPCPWFCDLNRLDRNEPNQAAYFELVTIGIRDARVGSPDVHGRFAYIYGGVAPTDLKGAAGELAQSWSSRPEEVEHAEILPPCQVEHIITVYYEK